MIGNGFLNLRRSFTSALSWKSCDWFWQFMLPSKRESDYLKSQYQNPKSQIISKSQFSKFKTNALGEWESWCFDSNDCAFYDSPLRQVPSGTQSFLLHLFRFRFRSLIFGALEFIWSLDIGVWGLPVPPMGENVWYLTTCYFAISECRIYGTGH